MAAHTRTELGGCCCVISLICLSIILGEGDATARWVGDPGGVETPAIGACCLPDGSCMEVDEGECSFWQGEYQGDGTTCDTVQCPELGECGWILTAPVLWDGDTSLEFDTCDLRSSKDAQFEIILPYDAEWTFSVCEAGWDTYLYLASACCEGDIAESDDHPDCGAGSKLILTLPAGTYYLTMEGFSSDDDGPFQLMISSPSCPGDIAGAYGGPDHVVDVLDLILVLVQWGTAGPEADITGPDGVPDGVVDDLDLLAIIAAWGPCP